MLSKWAQWTHWFSRVNSGVIWLWFVTGTLWGGAAAAAAAGSPGRNSHGSTPHSSLGCVPSHSCHCGWLWQFCHVWILIIMNQLNSLWHTGELFQNKFNSFFFFLKELFSPSMLQFSLFALDLNGIPEQPIDNIRMLPCDSHVCCGCLLCFAFLEKGKNNSSHCCKSSYLSGKLFHT